MTLVYRVPSTPLCSSPSLLLAFGTVDVIMMHSGTAIGSRYSILAWPDIGGVVSRHSAHRLDLVRIRGLPIESL